MKTVRSVRIVKTLAIAFCAVVVQATIGTAALWQASFTAEELYNNPDVQFPTRPPSLSSDRTQLLFEAGGSDYDKLLQLPLLKPGDVAPLAEGQTLVVHLEATLVRRVSSHGYVPYDWDPFLLLLHKGAVAGVCIGDDKDRAYFGSDAHPRFALQPGYELCSPPVPGYDQAVAVAFDITLDQQTSVAGVLPDCRNSVDLPADLAFDADSTLSLVFGADQSWERYALIGVEISVDLANNPNPVALAWNDPADIVYGTPLSFVQLNATATDPGTGSTVAGTFAYDPPLGTVLHAGNGRTLSVRFTPSEPGYGLASLSVPINVQPAPLTITAGAKQILAGQALPTFTATYEGFVSGDTPASLARPPTFSTTATPTSPPGDYPITVEGAASADYVITFQNGILQVVTPSVQSRYVYDFEGLNPGGLIGQDGWLKYGTDSWNKNGWVLNDGAGPGSGQYLGPYPNRNGVMRRYNDATWHYMIPEGTTFFAFEFDAKNLDGGTHWIQEGGWWEETYLLCVGLGPFNIGFTGQYNSDRFAVWTGAATAYALSSTYSRGESWHIKATVDLTANDGAGAVSLFAQNLSQGGNLDLIPGLQNVALGPCQVTDFNQLFVRLQTGRASPLIDNLTITVFGTPPANRPPVAQCQNVTVSAGANCSADASIDNGSYDPDNDPLVLTQSPGGPYPAGDTIVTLKVEDGQGGVDSCTAVVTVVDDEPPTLACPQDIRTVADPGQSSAVVSFTATFSDNCPGATVNCVPPSGSSFGLGTTSVRCEARDAAGQTAECWFSVTVLEATRPCFLHRTEPGVIPETFFFDGKAPTADNPKYVDSPPVTIKGGNLWEEVGMWSAAPGHVEGLLSELGAVTVWLGLKNSDDVGTWFDLRVETYLNDVLIAAGETYSIAGVVRNPSLAKRVSVPFGDFSPVRFDGTTDRLALKILTRIGTDGNGAWAGKHRSATGLRLYFDAATRPSGLTASFLP